MRCLTPFPTVLLTLTSLVWLATAGCGKTSPSDGGGVANALAGTPASHAPPPGTAGSTPAKKTGTDKTVKPPPRTVARAVPPKKVEAAAAAPGGLAAPSDVAAAPADARKTASGLASKVIHPGKGKTHPRATDTVKVHYTGWTTDGKMFDSSVKRGRPATFPLNRVIAGWTEGLQLMVVGEKRRFWIPQDLAYKGRTGPPKGMLVFDVELLDIVAPPKAPEAPSDVAAPPADAARTPTGLASKILKPGEGKRHPKASDQVTVHYTGWTTDGKMFDSSVKRGRPATFPLNRVIAGWTEGLQLMVVGEKRRLWIPEKLAYQGRAGAPAGMLVFDVELLGIKP